MDAETFKRRLIVGGLIVGAIFVGWGLIEGAQWFAGLMQIVASV